jgi:hypothetical protein
MVTQEDDVAGAVALVVTEITVLSVGVGVSRTKERLTVIVPTLSRVFLEYFGALTGSGIAARTDTVGLARQLVRMERRNTHQHTENDQYEKTKPTRSP